MMQRFLFSSKISVTPKLFVSTKVWKVQVKIPYEFSWKNKNGNERILNWKISQLLN